MFILMQVCLFKQKSILLYDMNLVTWETFVVTHINPFQNRFINMNTGNIVQVM